MKLRNRRILKYFALAFIPELILLASVLVVLGWGFWHHGYRQGVATNKVTEEQRQKLLNLSNKAITAVVKHEQVVSVLADRLSAVEKCQWGNTYAKRMMVKMAEHFTPVIAETSSPDDLRRSFIESLSIILRDGQISEAQLGLMDSQLKDLEQTSHLSCSNDVIDPRKLRPTQRQGEYVLKISSTLTKKIR